MEEKEEDVVKKRENDEGYVEEEKEREGEGKGRSTLRMDDVKEMERTR